MIVKTDYNVIGNSGCKLLAKMNILAISRISLGTYIVYIAYCQISNEAVRHLAKANWPKLAHLFIGIHFNNFRRQ